MATPQNGGSASAGAKPVVHLMPKLPTNSGDLGTCVQLKPGEEYLLDGRVTQGNVGCGWKAPDTDVDLSLALFDHANKCVDVIWWDKIHSHYVSCSHLNDDRNGTALEGSDVNERISVKFSEVPPSVHYILVVLTVYSKGKTLKDVSDIHLKLSHDVSETKSQDLFNFALGTFDTAGAVLGLFSRVGSWWKFKAIGETAVGRTVKEVVYNMSLDQVVTEAATNSNKMKVYAKALEGHGLAASDRPICGPRTSDCFVEIKINSLRTVSEVIMKTLDPKWNMPKFELGMTNEADYSVIEFNVWDHDTNSPDDFLGSALVAVGGVCQKGVGTHKMTLELGPSPDPKIQPKQGVKISGSIDVVFEVTSVDA